MILYTFTTDGGDREDGNVYYSPVMVVHNADPITHGQDVHDKVLAALAMFGAHDSVHRDIHMDKEGVDPQDGSDWFYHDAPEWTERVTAALNAAGYVADFPPTNYVVAS